jgi:hypothetical protein
MTTAADLARLSPAVILRRILAVRGDARVNVVLDLRSHFGARQARPKPRSNRMPTAAIRWG